METENLIATIEKVVSEINAEIYEIVDDPDFMDEFPIEVECISNGRSTVIMFLGFRLWSSDDDERHFIVDTKDESREPINIYIRKEINRIINKIASVGRINAN